MRELYKRLRFNRYRVIRIGWRLFTVEEPRRTRLRFYYGQIKPLPRHRGTQTGRMPDGSHVQMPAHTVTMFRRDGDKGTFKRIDVVQERGRRKWATDMVRALLKAHPDATWQNEVLNENSGPLFQLLSSRFPNRIATVTVDHDGSYRIGPRPRPGKPE